MYIEQLNQPTQSEGGAREESPYVLLPERLTAPEKDVRPWLEEIIDLQREGISDGVRPQNLIGLSNRSQKEWLRKVWNYYRRIQSGGQPLI